MYCHILSKILFFLLFFITFIKQDMYIAELTNICFNKPLHKDNITKFKRVNSKIQLTITQSLISHDSLFPTEVSHSTPVH